MDKLKVAVIGVGNMGRHHARIYSKLTEVDLIAVVDTNISVGKNIADIYKVDFFDDYKILLDKVDAVSISTPTSSHYKIAKFFLENKKHVLLEKPMTDNILQAQELVDLAKRNKVILQIGHVERFNPAVLELSSFVKSPIFIESHRMNPPSTRNLDVGVVIELMIHDLDIILSLVNSEIEKINALGIQVYSNYEDLAQVQILFKNGCLANLTASRISAEKIRNLEITQEDAFLHLDYIDQNIILRKQVSSDYVFIANQKPGYRREFVVQQPLISKNEPLKLELSHFINCILKKKEPIVSGSHGLKALKLAKEISEIISKSVFRDSKLAKEILTIT